MEGLLFSICITTRVRWLILGAVAWLGQASLVSVGAQEAKPMVAFIAAVSDYPGNAALYESISNAELLASGLEDFGFDVTTLFNFYREDFDEAFGEWCQQTADAELALVYFCGHGGNFEGESYLIPSETDIDSATSMKEQGISFSEGLLRHLNRHSETDSRLRLLVVDGFQKNPFFLGGEQYSSSGRSYSGFIKPANMGEKLVLLLPTRFPGGVVHRQDSRLLVELMLVNLFSDGQSLRSGLSNLRDAFHERTDNRQSTWEEIRFDGTYTFREGDSEEIRFAGPQPLNAGGEGAEVVSESSFETRRDAALAAEKEKRFEDAVSLWVEVYEAHPEKRKMTRNRLRGVLATEDILTSPTRGKRFVESAEYDFLDLVRSPEEGGWGLPEARKIYWETGRYYWKDEALLWVMQDASAGDGRAMHVGARILYDFDRHEEAHKWFLKASKAEADPVDSFLFLGRMHWLGQGCEKSVEKAVEYFMHAQAKREGITMGSPLAAVFIGDIEVEKQYSEDNEVQDFSEAAKFYEEARLLETYRGSANLGQLYLFGLPGVERDPERGIEILLEGAESGRDTQCMWYIAKNHFADGFPSIGLVSPVDEYTAVRYARVSADVGWPEAVAFCEERGIDYADAGSELFLDSVAYRDWKINEQQIVATKTGKWGQ